MEMISIPKQVVEAIQNYLSTTREVQLTMALQQALQQPEKPKEDKK